MAKDLEVKIEASNSSYDSNDARWIDQVNELYQDLQSSAGRVRRETTPISGKKGGVEAIILALGSAGAIKAAVSMFRAWLKRDRSRNIKLAIKKGDESLEYEVSATGMNEDVIEDIMNKALTHLDK